MNFRLYIGNMYVMKIKMYFMGDYYFRWSPINKP